MLDVLITSLQQLAMGFSVIAMIAAVIFIVWAVVVELAIYKQRQRDLSIFETIEELRRDFNQHS